MSAGEAGAPRWRAGRHVFRTLYLDGRLVGMMDTPELAAGVVAAMNGSGALSGLVIEMEARSVYGLARLYVTNEPARTALSNLTGRVSFRREDVGILERLGFSVQVRDVVP